MGFKLRSSYVFIFLLLAGLTAVILYPPRKPGRSISILQPSTIRLSGNGSTPADHPVPQPTETPVPTAFLAQPTLSPIPTKLPDVPEKPINRILFIGNSYTSANTLPELFRNVTAGAGREPPFVKWYSPGAYTIEKHMADTNATDMIKSGPWDIIVIQEQSSIPSFSKVNRAFHDDSIASVAGLTRMAMESSPDAVIVLFETWARAAFIWDNGSADYNRDGTNPDEMQERIKKWYEEAAAAVEKEGLPARIARVGEIWQLNYHSSDPVNLHDSDGSHPNFEGSYVAALSLYSVIYRETSDNVTYRGSLSESTALRLRQLAGQIR